MNIQVSNLSIPTANFYVGKLVALQETSAVAGNNAALTVGAHRIRLPPELQGKPCVNGQPAGYTPAEPGFPHGKLTVRGCADYIECRDVRNASSCRVFDANNNEIQTSGGDAGAVRIDSVASSSGSELLAPGQPGVSLCYSAGEAAVRVEATVFEWSQARLGPF